MITLAQARTYLSRYAGANNDFTTRINLGTERLVKNGNWRGTKDAVVFQVHLNDDDTAFITLPWQYNTVLAAVVFKFDNQNDQTRLCGFPMQIQDEWFSYLGSGVGYMRNSLYNWGNGFIPETGRFTTFKDWVIPAQLRFKFAATEANTGQIINVRGVFNGQPIYTGTGAATIEGENLTINGSTGLTTSSFFDKPPYALVKPQTYGVVSMYTVVSGVETLVARYMPTETVPQWRRYRVPACSGWTEADPGQFLAVLKREWVPISNDNDFVVPGNIGALKFMLMAQLKEDAEAFTQAESFWGKSEQLLANEVEDDTGANAHTPVQVADSFMLGNGIVAGTYAGGWYGTYYGGANW